MAETHTDVFVGAYPDTDAAMREFDALVALVEGRQVEIEAAILPSGTARCRCSAPSRSSWAPDNGGVVDLAYEDKAPDEFTGTVKRVVFDLKPAGTHEDEKALHEHQTKVAVGQGIHG